MTGTIAARELWKPGENHYREERDDGETWVSRTIFSRTIFNRSTFPWWIVTTGPMTVALKVSPLSHNVGIQ